MAEKKGRSRRRERQHREENINPDIQYSFQTKEYAFARDGNAEFAGSKKLGKLKNKADKAEKKVGKAKKKLKKTDYSFGWEFDEKTGKAVLALYRGKKEKTFKPDSPAKSAARKLGAEASYRIHGKIAESEKDNSAVEGAHKTEQKVEEGIRYIRHHRKSRIQRQHKKLAKREKEHFKKEVKFRYRKFIEENPEMQEKNLKRLIQKRMQKRRIKKEYAKARREAQAAENVKETVVTSANAATAVAKKLQEMAGKTAKLVVIIGIAALLLIIIMTIVSSCGAMFSDSAGTVLIGSYMSLPADIDAAELAFTELEKNLQAKINAIETTYPGYDEYQYTLASIGHNPFVLISYLSAIYTEFTAAQVQGDIESLFDEMYELTLNPRIDTRTRTVTKTGTRTVTNPATGEEREEEYEYEEEEEYTVTVLEVTLQVSDLGGIVAGHMSEEQKELYDLYNDTHGLIQRFFSPVSQDWYGNVSSYYGWRINPLSGAEQLHRGVDIAVPAGTTVYAAMSGTVTTAAYDSSYGNYVVIEDENGYCTKYAHMETINVSAGQNITHGTAIGTVGSTGSSTGYHLHIECLFNGEYYNPLFYFRSGG